jgi:hypothetical protein
MGNFIYERIEDGVKKDKYNDLKMRETWIKFAEEVLGKKFIHGTEKGIDNLFEDGTYGAEGENALWSGDRWVSNQRDRFGLGINTLNMPNRKWFYFGLGELSEKNTFQYRIISHVGFEKNIYYRFNAEMDQLIVVYSDTIRDFTKIKFAFDRKVNNSYEAEDWICIPQEFCFTYNKQRDGKWVLNGPYCGLTEEEKRQRVAEVANKIFSK